MIDRDSAPPPAIGGAPASSSSIPPGGIGGAPASSSGTALLFSPPPGLYQLPPPPPQGPAPSGLVDGEIRPPANVDPVVSGWKVDDVITFAVSLELPHLEPLIRREGVDGPLLLQSSHVDLVDAGFTKTQAKNLLTRLPSAPPLR